MTLLLLSPLFISIFFLSFSFLLVLKRHNQTYFLCYTTGAKIQKTLQGYLKKLILMNTQAKLLRIQRSAAELRYNSALMSLEPISISSAWKHLKEVKSLQKSFSRKQESILQKAKQSFQTQWGAFKLEFKKYAHQVKKTFYLQPLAVRKEPSESDSPDYVLVNNFSKNQKLKISWSMDGFDLIPQSIRRYLELESMSYHYCSVSLGDMKDNFQIKLMK